MRDLGALLVRDVLAGGDGNLPAALVRHLEEQDVRPVTSHIGSPGCTALLPVLGVALVLELLLALLVVLGVALVLVLVSSSESSGAPVRTWPRCSSAEAEPPTSPQPDSVMNLVNQSTSPCSKAPRQTSSSVSLGLAARRADGLAARGGGVGQQLAAPAE